MRERLLALADLEPGDRVLEVGSGTGAITVDLGRDLTRQVFGVDIDGHSTRFAADHDPNSNYSIADGFSLPFPGQTFDLVICHFLLLWVRNPETIVAEMLRIVRPGAWVLACAEPDYGGRIDYPGELEELGSLQIKALEHAGADPFIGRRIRAVFHEAGADDVRSGILGAEWEAHDLKQVLESEWEILKLDLKGEVTQARISEWADKDRAAVEQDLRTLFVPTFFAMGRSRT